ncbi:GNAT family N-acetyltransferase [Bacillaceae bacterium SIJ1]|uniref:GNAT family N-acetyltransferase n=1 Tax=Litoribacterium kuwaitense TaxID=1398745 RepID=UPI0013EBF9C1|nr:GNAT family N-acetyltransferase [Litoribacterium kuwaitense]NGP44749.1 GNAT family N-acetyltransferase [Litoribacterium kuwaitense]
MQFKPITSEDIQAIIQLWNETLNETFPMRAALFVQNTFEDPNWLPEGSRGAWKNDELVGIVTAKRWQEGDAIPAYQSMGWIQALLVKREHRNKGIGTALLRHAEAALVRAGATDLYIGRDPGDFFPGWPAEDEMATAWLERLGYENEGRVFDLKRTEPGPVVEAVFPDHVEARTLTADEADRFIAFLDREFPGRWAYEARKYFAAGGTGEDYMVLLDQGDIVGFARMNGGKTPIIGQNVYWAPLFAGSLGGVGPLGVAKHVRGKGYGKNIISAAVNHVQATGVKYQVIDWTGHEGLYEKWGFTPYKYYALYGKRVRP